MHVSAMRLTGWMQTVDAFRGSPDLRQDPLIDDWLPSVRTYLALTASLGHRWPG
jgi:hypothetical protein